jgi:hypothetical protein
MWFLPCHFASFSFIDLGPVSAQRLAAQPLGHFRFVVTILAGFLNPQFSVFSLSLGQVGCSRGLGNLKTP